MAALVAVGVALPVALAGGAVGVGGHAVTQDPCFGAGSRDPRRHCDDAALRLRVVPTPANAQLVTPPPCAVEDRTPALFVCGYGTVRGRQLATVALLGDSHAAHWRPAVEALALQHRWRVVSMSRAGCPVTLAIPRLADRGRGRGCLRWSRAVLRWLARHREVSVVFVSQHRFVPVARKGHVRSALRNGYVNAWRRMLRHGVRHVVVIRDSPRDTPRTQACVAAALAAGTPAGPACAVPRSYAVRSDPAALAARATGDARVQVVDLTDVFCSARFCLPVIGGALVHRDTEHMTRQFVRTLAPFLGGAVDRLMASWPDRRSVAAGFTQDAATAPTGSGLPPPGRRPRAR